MVSLLGWTGGIDGLVHLSDISWEEGVEDAAHNFKKGDEIETVILAVDPERERISLGVKQLDSDPVSAFLADHPKGCIVKGVVLEVDARAALIELAEGVEGQLRASEISAERVEDARTLLKVGEEVEARVTGLDRKSRIVSLSIKAKEAHEEAEAVQSYRSDSESSGSGTTLGDLLKAKIGSGE